MNLSIDIPELIQKLPISVVLRMKLERNYIMAVKGMKNFCGIAEESGSAYYPLVRNNRLYGDEYLLRKYSGSKEYLYGIIEHGLYFGNNSTKVGLKHEWELGCILTSGSYRKDLITQVFPDYYCETIGPMIHYAELDEEYYTYIKAQLRTGSQTLLFFPVHGSALYKPKYDKELALKEILKLAEENNCENILLCVYVTDISEFKEVISKIGLENRFIVVSCGNRYSEKFLCRQKAIILASDISASNNLGTHLGYCIYLGKPHILLPQEFYYSGDRKALENEFSAQNRSNNYEDDFGQEKIMFQEIFNRGCRFITENQVQLCDYYWGFSKVKTPDEIHEIFEICKKQANKKA